MQDTELRQLARAQHLPMMDYLLNETKRIAQETGIKRTIFAACPNSEAVIKAALRSAMRNNAPIKFAATLNQVDMDGGYTGMTQQTFVEMIRREANAICFNGPVIIALDHGGPWLKDIQTIENWDLQKSMDWVKKSLEASIDAGYDLLHIDPTVDVTLPAGSTMPIELVAERTLELIAHSEAHRRSHDHPPIAYEVGTEEVHGGLADMDTFRKFLTLLKEGLAQRQLADVWPCFVVGKVGTDLHTALFDPVVARELTEVAAAYGSVIKGHYSDSVSNPQDYPLSGMGAANVGPEFTEAEFDGLTLLSEREEALIQSGVLATGSNFLRHLEDAVEQSGRWKKWLHPDEQGLGFQQLSSERKMWLLKTGCRYIWAQKPVVAARQRLYANLESNGVPAESVVLLHIERAMDNYFIHFNLRNLNALL
jgi:D-tagatose-1,6-bisphosphate aldolase subunit GatZ/KbaZ